MSSKDSNDCDGGLHPLTVEQLHRSHILSRAIVLEEHHHSDISPDKKRALALIDLIMVLKRRPATVFPIDGDRLIGG